MKFEWEGEVGVTVGVFHVNGKAKITIEGNSEDIRREFQQWAELLINYLTQLKNLIVGWFASQ